MRPQFGRVTAQLIRPSITDAKQTGTPQSRLALKKWEVGSGVTNAINDIKVNSVDHATDFSPMGLARGKWRSGERLMTVDVPSGAKPDPATSRLTSGLRYRLFGFGGALS